MSALGTLPWLAYYRSGAIGPVPPPPFEADYYVVDGGTGDGLTPETPASWSTAYAAASDGDVIGLVGDVTLPQAVTIAKAITIRGQKGEFDEDPLGTGQQVGNRFQRLYALKLVPPNAPGSGTIRHFMMATGEEFRLENVGLTHTGWPEGGQPWETIGVNGEQGSYYIGLDANTRIYMDGCEAWKGHGPDQDPYDPTVKLDEFKSPAIYWFKAKADNPNQSWGDITANEAEKVTGSQSYVGWGDAEFPGYNTTMRGPNLLDERWGGGVIENCYVHDMREVIKVRSSGARNFVIRRNWFERIYCDYTQFQLTNTVSDMTGSLLMEQNIFLDPFGCNLDNGDPHIDFFQGYATRPEANQANATRMRNITSQRNFWGITRAGVRGLAQGHFIQTSSDHQVNNKAVLDYPVIRDNVAIGGVYKAFVNEGVRDPIFTRNLMINPTWFTPQILSQPADLAFTRISPVTGTARVTYTDTVALSKHNIVEKYFANMSADTEGQYVTGFKGAEITHSAMFVDPSAPAGVIKPGVLYNKYRPKGAYVGAGPSFPSLYELAFGEVDYSGQDTWLGVPDLVNQPASTQVTSQIFFCHGGEFGTPISVTLPAGVEMRTLQIDRTTQIAGYTNTPTVTAGMYGQLRVTTPATGFVNYDITMNGETRTWFVGRGYPGDPSQYLVADGTSWLYSPANIPSGVKKVRAEFWFRLDALPTSGVTFGFFSQPGARIILEVLNNGSMRTSLRDSANNALFNLVGFAGLSIVAGNSYRCAYEADMEAKTVIFTVNGQEFPLQSAVTSTGLFTAGRLMIGANADNNATGRFANGVRFGDYKIYLDDALYHEVSNDAAVTNASAWRQGDGYTQGES